MSGALYVGSTQAGVDVVGTLMTVRDLAQTASEGGTGELASGGDARVASNGFGAIDSRASSSSTTTNASRSTAAPAKSKSPSSQSASQRPLPTVPATALQK